jgi:hypothetical protein
MSTRDEVTAAFNGTVAQTWDLDGMRTGGAAAIREATVAYALGGTETALAAVVTKFTSPDMRGPLTTDCITAARPFRRES